MKNCVNAKEPIKCEVFIARRRCGKIIRRTMDNCKRGHSVVQCSHVLCRSTSRTVCFTPQPTLKVKWLLYYIGAKLNEKYLKRSSSSTVGF